MRKYKTELHCHSSEVSGCSSVNINDVVEKYIEHGYTSLVLTNHLYTFNLFEEYKAKVDLLFDTCAKAREIAGDRLNVLDGVEFRLDDGNDYLLFGVTKEFLLSDPELSDLEAHELKEKAEKYGIIVIHAHPLRFNQRHLHPSAIHGYEVFNGHPEQRSNNEAVDLIFAPMAKEGKILTSGTDHHDGHHMPNAGIVTDAPITSLDELTATLRSGNYSLIKGDKIVEL